MADTKSHENISYIQMKTKTRLNYRNACDFTPESIAGVLENGATVRIVEDWKQFSHGHIWRKAKIGRRHYFVCADWLV